MRLLLLALLAACGPDVSVSKVAVDADNDGYDAEKDCDDGRSDVNPTAPELCDGRDNDCDEVVDEEAEDAATFYADTDGDGFGDADAPTEACEAPEGTTEDATDCDDAVATVFPGADELCNGTDDDCDGDIDGDALDAATLYADADGDGYGDAATGVTACEHPAGYIADATDCDDADADVHPDAPEADCADPTDYNCDGSVAYADLDADGWAACEDCDDTDAARSPGLPEVCDGAVDEDCDALVDDEDPDVTDPATWYRDADADAWGNAGLTTLACAEPTGFVAVSGDCDDVDPARSPGLSEVCDAANLDEDCSGAADDADAGTDAATFTTWARDADTDGYGDPGRTVTQCDAPAGYGADATDCDDTDAAVSPAAAEVCNGVDDDCDALVDDADAGVTDPATWYADTDADGYGGPTTALACDAPAGHVATSTDCDDADAADFPGAPETCNGDDEDCDGTADDGVTTLFYADADADGYGGTTTTAACSVPAGHVATSTDCDDTSAAVSPAATEVCNGVDDDCDALTDDADGSVTGTTTWYADADGDGYGDADTTVSACDAPPDYGTDTTDCDDGAADAYPGGVEVCGDGVDQDCDGVDPSCGLSGAYTTDDADVVVVGGVAGARFAVGFSAGFDYDGDGWEDLALTSGYDSAAYGGNYGVLDVLTDVPAGTSVGHDVAAFHAYGDVTNDDLEASNPHGLNDLDGDGFDEVLVVQTVSVPLIRTLIAGNQPTSNLLFTTVDTGAYACNIAASAGTSNALTGYQDWLCGDSGGGSATEGAVSVYSGVGTLVGSIVGEDPYDNAGSGVHGGDDLDGDGYDDYVIGAQAEDGGGAGSGAFYVVYAPISTSVTLELADADAKVTGAAAGDGLGSRIEGVADVDADGYLDIVSSAYGDDRGAASGGSATIYFGPLLGTLGMASADVTVYGIAATALGQGNSCGSVGDADGDGIVDLLVGAGAEASAGAYTGKAWLLTGPLTGAYDLGAGDYDSAFSGTRSDEYLGYRCALHDLNHDGLDDVVISAPLSDPGGAEDLGAIYGFYGG